MSRLDRLVRWDQGPSRRLTATLGAGLLVGGTFGCAPPDETSFFDSKIAKITSGSSAEPVAIYPLGIGQDSTLFETLPAGSLETVSLSSSIDCLAALRVTQLRLAQQGGGLSKQAIHAMQTAEKLFREHAESQIKPEGLATAELSVATEKETQLLLESPGDAANQALTCLREISAEI